MWECIVLAKKGLNVLLLLSVAKTKEFTIPDFLIVQMK